MAMIMDLSEKSLTMKVVIGNATTPTAMYNQVSTFQCGLGGLFAHSYSRLIQPGMLKKIALLAPLPHFMA